jgi:hypothetical protein
VAWPCDRFMSDPGPLDEVARGEFKAQRAAIGSHAGSDGARPRLLDLCQASTRCQLERLARWRGPAERAIAVGSQAQVARAISGITGNPLQTGSCRPQDLVRIGAGGNRLCRYIALTTQRTLLLCALGECSNGRLHQCPRLLRAALLNDLEYDAFNALALIGGSQKVGQHRGRSKVRRQRHCQNDPSGPAALIQPAESSIERQVNRFPISSQKAPGGSSGAAVLLKQYANHIFNLDFSASWRSLAVRLQKTLTADAPVYRLPATRPPAIWRIELGRCDYSGSPSQ